MKKVLLMFMAAGLLIATPSCKKGENDPGLSLKSRKARLAGEYDISSWVYTIARTYTNGDRTEYKRTITGSTGTIVNSSTDDDGTYSTTRNLAVDKATFTIMKDGTWESEVNITETETDNDGWGGVTSWTWTTVSTMKQSGSWSFLGGQAEDFKNKERVAFNTLTQTSSDQTTTTVNYDDGASTSEAGTAYSDSETFGEGQNTLIYEIDQLKSKEVIFKSDEGFAYTDSEVEDGVTTSYSVTATGSTEMTLTAK